MSKIYIQPPDYDNFDKFLEYAKEHGYNLEISYFAYSNVLDANWQAILKDHQQKLQSFEGTISIHGAFQDLIVHSRDNRIRDIAKDRIFQNLEIAKILNAKYVIFHGNFNPLITQKSYEQNWVEQNARFWSEAVNKYDTAVLLENLWEPTPKILRKLLDEIKSPRLKICFDTGHANIFSKVPFEEWFTVLCEDIPYIHVNDNKGNVDNELVPGEGTVNWQKFSDLIKKCQIDPKVVFEVGTLEKTIQSLKYFREENIYPFNVFARNSI